MKTNLRFWPYVTHFLEWEMFQTKVVEKVKRRFLHSVTSPPPQNRACCETMWKNVVEPDRPQMIIRRMRIACWIPKATNTHSEHGIFIVFPPQQWLHERASMLRYMYIASLVLRHLVLITVNFVSCSDSDAEFW